MPRFRVVTVDTNGVKKAYFASGVDEAEVVARITAKGFVISDVAPAEDDQPPPHMIPQRVAFGTGTEGTILRVLLYISLVPALPSALAGSGFGAVAVVVALAGLAASSARK